jgi:hypothetical protein
MHLALEKYLFTTSTSPLLGESIVLQVLYPCLFLGGSANFIFGMRLSRGHLGHFFDSTEASRILENSVK